MKLNPIKPNVTELEYSNGYVLFSYKTPVVVTMKSTGEVFVTNKKWSRTTRKHINQWLNDFPITKDDIKYVNQSTIERLTNK